MNPLVIRLAVAGLLLAASGCASSKPAVKEEDRKRIDKAFAELEGKQEAGGPEDKKTALQDQPQVKVPPPKKKGPRPDWVDMSPQDPTYYHGVGSSSEGWEQARSRALGDLASQIQVQVTSIVRSVTTERGYTRDRAAGTEVTSDFVHEVKLLAQQTVADYEIVGQWAGQNQYWVYVRIAREKVKERLEKDLSDAIKIATDHYMAGTREEKGGDISEALKSYTRGLAALRKFLGQPIETDIGGKRVILNNEIERAISRLLANVELKPEEPTKQKARTGKPLAEPLAIAVSYKGRALVDIPIRFSFVKGEGELEQQLRTDIEGRAASHVHRVATVERANMVEARIDLEELTGQEASQVEGLRAYLEKIGGRPVVFFISTEETRILVQVEESNLGLPVHDSYFASFIKDRLAEETGATFTEMRQDANLLLKGRVSSRFSSQEGKINFCYADVVMSLQDLKTGEELYSKKLDRVKGYHLNREEAGRRAIEAAAVEIAGELMKYVGREAGP